MLSHTADYLEHAHDPAAGHELRNGDPAPNRVARILQIGGLPSRVPRFPRVNQYRAAVVRAPTPVFYIFARMQKGPRERLLNAQAPHPGFDKLAKLSARVQRQVKLQLSIL